MTTNGKTRAHYVAMLNAFKELMARNLGGREFFGRGGEGPLNIMKDDDADLSAAITRVWPSTRQRLCLKHILWSVEDYLAAVRGNVPAEHGKALNSAFVEMCDRTLSAQDFFQKEKELCQLGNRLYLSNGFKAFAGRQKVDSLQNLVCKLSPSSHGVRTMTKQQLLAALDALPVDEQIKYMENLRRSLDMGGSVVDENNPPAVAPGSFADYYVSRLRNRLDDWVPHMVLRDHTMRGILYDNISEANVGKIRRRMCRLVSFSMGEFVIHFKSYVESVGDVIMSSAINWERDGPEYPKKQLGKIGGSKCADPTRSSVRLQLTNTRINTNGIAIVPSSDISRGPYRVDLVRGICSCSYHQGYHGLCRHLLLIYRHLSGELGPLLYFPPMSPRDRTSRLYFARVACGDDKVRLLLAENDRIFGIPLPPGTSKITGHLGPWMVRTRELAESSDAVFIDLVRLLRSLSGGFVGLSGSLTGVNDGSEHVAGSSAADSRGRVQSQMNDNHLPIEQIDQIGLRARGPNVSDSEIFTDLFGPRLAQEIRDSPHFASRIKYWLGRMVPERVANETTTSAELDSLSLDLIAHSRGDKDMYISSKYGLRRHGTTMATQKNHVRRGPRG